MEEDERSPKERELKEDPSKSLKKPFRYITDPSEIQVTTSSIEDISVMKKDGMIQPENLTKNFESIACVGDINRIESVLKKHEKRKNKE